MRTRRYANHEQIRSKEFRLLEVLRRLEAARLASILPRGVIGSLSYSAPVGSTTVTINTPLLAVVPTASELWVVDHDPTPDPTGGFGDVTIPAAKQLAELNNSQIVSFTGHPAGTYIIYATHELREQHPEVRHPPGKFAAGGGSFEEHRDFFGHAHADGEPIPREDYDPTRTPTTVSEVVDRLVITSALGTTPPADGVALVRVEWSGSAILSTENASRALDLAVLFDHLGAGGQAHPVATAISNGFMSAADKLKLDALGDTVDGHDHDGRYLRYDQAQTLNNTQQTQARANIGAAADSHNHNTLYYTKTQVDSLLNGKLNTNGTAANSSQLGGHGPSSYVRTDANTTVAAGVTTNFNGTLNITGTLRVPLK